MNEDRIKLTSHNKLSDEPITVQSGELIFAEGEDANGVYMVNKNTVKICKKDLKGKNRVMWFAKPNEFIGLTAHFENSQKYCCSAIAINDESELVYISKAEFKKLLSKKFELRREIINTFCKRIAFTEMRSGLQMQGNVKDRTLRILSYLCHCMTEKDGQIVSVKLQYSISELSQLVITFPSYLKKVLEDLKTTGLISWDSGNIYVHDLEKLDSHIN